jgi:predicted TPR repeat methyltransferase
MTVQEANDSIQVALKLHQSGQIAEAEAIYREVLSNSPDHPDALRLLGMVAWQAGQGDDAIALLRKALSVRPGYLEALSELGMLFVGQGRYDEAVACCQKTIAIQPDNAEAYFNMGSVLTRQDKVGAAVECFLKAISLRPEFPEAYNNMGAVLVEQGRDDEGIECYRKAIALRPDYGGALVNLGLALASRGRLDDAAECYRKAIAARPDYVEAHYNIGAVLARQGKFDDAIASYWKALAIRPVIPEAYNNMGSILAEQGKADGALECYRRAITLRPDYAEAHYNMGSVLTGQGKADEAQASYRRVMEIAPGNESALHMIAAVTGSNAERAPDRYVAQLFDGYAEKFDAHLREELKYRIPEQIVALMREAAGPAAGRWDVLDLGCGTGLVGAAIAPYARQLVGVDLSGKMLELARARNVYTRLEQSGMSEVVLGEASASYDLVTAADVFIHTGRLDDLFAEVKRVLRPDGLFGFTVEALDALPAMQAADGTLREAWLQPTGRFAHASAYIRKIALDCGFETEHFESATVRLEGGVPVEGRLVMLRRARAGRE